MKYTINTGSGLKWFSINNKRYQKSQISTTTNRNNNISTLTILYGNHHLILDNVPATDLWVDGVQLASTEAAMNTFLDSLFA